MKLFGLDLFPVHRWKLQIMRIRAAHKLKLWWRLKVPQFFCGLLKRHVWSSTIDWTHAGKICGRCLKKVTTRRWDAQGRDVPL